MSQVGTRGWWLCQGRPTKLSDARWSPARPSSTVTSVVPNCVLQPCPHLGFHGLHSVNPLIQSVPRHLSDIYFIVIANNILKLHSLSLCHTWTLYCPHLHTRLPSTPLCSCLYCQLNIIISISEIKTNNDDFALRLHQEGVTLVFLSESLSVFLLSKMFFH